MRAKFQTVVESENCHYFNEWVTVGCEPVTIDEFMACFILPVGLCQIIYNIGIWPLNPRKVLKIYS